MRENGKRKLLNLVYIAMFAAIIVVCSQIQIPFGQIPFTLQTLGVFAASAMLGTKRGTACVTLYVLMGLIGLPVFAGFTGGVGILLGPTGGYIIGFIFTALIIGVMNKLFGRKWWMMIISMTVGMAGCYLFGTIWFMIVAKTDFAAAVMLCVVPYIIVDGIKIVTAAVLVNRLEKAVKL